MQPFTSTYRKSCHSLQHSWNSAYGTGDTGCSLMVWHSLSMIYIDVPLWCDTVSRSIIYRQGKLSISCLHRQWKHPWSSKKNLEALLCKIYEAISFHSLVEYLHLRIQTSNCSQCSEYIHLQSLRPTYLQLIHNAPILQSKNGCMGNSLPIKLLHLWRQTLQVQPKLSWLNMVVCGCKPDSC